MLRGSFRSVRPASLAGALLVASAAVPLAAFAAGEPAQPSLFGDQVYGVAAEPNGKTVAVGALGSSMLVQRVAAGGQIETTFAATPGLARAVAEQTDGKVLVAGTDGGAAVVRRFKADGTLDTAFGTAGTARIPGTSANAVAFGPCGTIVVGGAIRGGDGFSRVSLTRLLADGTGDPTFGSGGSTTIDLSSGSEVRGLAIQPDGKVVFAGQQMPGLQVTNALVGRVTASGTLDSSFSGGVYYYYHPDGGAASTFNAVTIDPSGRVLAAGGDRQESTTKAVFVRLTPNGSPDGSFGTNGLLRPDSSRSYNGAEPVGGRGIAVAGNGRIVAAGAYQDSGLRSAALYVITPGGALDTSVGSGGIVVTSPGENGGQARAVAVTPDGTIVAGGDAERAPEPSRGFLQRYAGFGAPPAAATCTTAPPTSTTPTTTTPPPTTTAPPATTTQPTTTTPPPPDAGSQPPFVQTPKPVPAPAPTPAAARLTKTTLAPSVLSSAGSTLTFSLSRAATVSLRLQVLRPGKRVGGRCVSKTSKNVRSPSCTYFQTLTGSKVLKGTKGTNRLKVTTTFRGRRLSAGKYRLVLRAAGGNQRLLNATVKVARRTP